MYIWIKRTKVILCFAGTVEFASDSSQEQLFCFIPVINKTTPSLKITIYCIYLHLKQKNSDINISEEVSIMFLCTSMGDKKGPGL